MVSSLDRQARNVHLLNGMTKRLKDWEDALFSLFLKGEASFQTRLVGRIPYDSSESHYPLYLIIERSAKVHSRATELYLLLVNALAAHTLT